MSLGNRTVKTYIFILALPLLLLSLLATDPAAVMAQGSNVLVQDGDESIIVDPQTGNNVITYVGDDGTLRQVIWVPATKVEPKARSTVTSGQEDTFLYSYKVKNDTEAGQPLFLISMIASDVVASDPLAPTGWEGSTRPNFGGEGMRVTWSIELRTSVDDGLAPGNMLMGFSLESRHLPGVGTVRFHGLTPTLAFPDEGPGDTIGDFLEEHRNPDVDNVPQHTAVPTIPVPEPFDAAAILNDIQKHVQELVGMELVEPVFAGQLDGLFTAAGEALGRNDTASALSHIKDLQLLINEEAGDDNEEWDSQETASPTLLINQLAARVLLFDVGFVIGRFDTDGDGIPDDQDACPASDTTPTVIIDGCDSGVANTFPEQGCTISDKIGQCAEGAQDHGKFVSCVAKLTNDLKKAGIITGQQKGAIQSCAAQADIP